MTPIPVDETERMADLEALKVLDTPREPRFERITAMMPAGFDGPMVFVTLIDRDRQWYKSTFGAGELASTPRAGGFCAEAICEPEPMILLNAKEDERFRDHPNVTGELHVRFYAGVPLHGLAGKRIGSLSIIDTKPRDFSPRDLAILRKFGAVIDTQLHL